KGEEYLVEIGPHTFGIPEGGQAMEGMKVGDKRDVTLGPPKTSSDDPGKSVTLKVELLEIKTKTYPPLTDSLAGELGHSSAKDMESKIKRGLEDANLRRVEEEVNGQIMDKLVQENDPVVPSFLLEKNMELMQRDMIENLQKSGKSDDEIKESLDKNLDEMAQNATFLIKRELILNALATKYSISVSDDDARGEYEQAIASLGLPPNQSQSFMELGEENLQRFKNRVREKKVLQKVREKVQIETTS
ncbi:MAG: hypothetical protein OXB88_04940, partial [Bacteriovoracales bacterium]|nr:hypothetical protein [Bacteriovoracales bacterium]